MPTTIGQVGQSDGAEVLPYLRGLLAGVVDDEPGQQPSFGRRQRIDGSTQPGPQVSSGPLDGAGTGQHHRRTAAGEHGSDVVSALGWPQSSFGLDPLAGQQRQPGRVRGQHHDRGAKAVRPAGRPQHLDPHPGDDQLAIGPPGWAQSLPRVVEQDRLDGDGGRPVGSGRERSGAARGRVQRGHGRRGGGAAEHGHEHQQPTPAVHTEQHDREDQHDGRGTEEHLRCKQAALPGHDPRRERRRHEA